MKQILAAIVLLLAACSAPSTGVKVIVGAQLDPGRGQPRLEHSVIIIRDGKFQEAGPQASTPVPKGAEITSGNGKVVAPATESGLIAPGEPADLILRDAATLSVESTMHNGEWMR